MSWSVYPLLGENYLRTSYLSTAWQIYEAMLNYLRTSYLSTAWQIYEAMYLLLRVQGHSALHGGWDTDLFICPLGSQTQEY
jgi:hypothetical protein